MVVVRKGDISDEVSVTSHGELWVSVDVLVFFGLEVPFDEGFVSGSTDEDIGIFVFFLGVSSDDGGDPIGVSL